MNPQTMTCEECRDELARRKGWRIFTMPSGVKLYLAPGKPDDADCQTDCPYPPTLDGAAGAVPEGWNWYRQIGPQDVYWEGRNDTYHHILRSRLRVVVTDTGNPITDLYRLALLCVIAGEKTT